MRYQIKLVLWLMTLLLLIPASPGLAQAPAPGSDADPLMTKSYFDNLVNQKTANQVQKLDQIAAQLNQIEARAARLKEALEAVITLQIGKNQAQIGSRQVTLDVPPQLANGRTILPLRFIGEALGAVVGWDGATKTVTYRLNGRTVKLTVGQRTADIDGVVRELDVPVQMINGRTLVPLRFISEALGARVVWNAPTKTVKISRQ